MYDYSVYNEKAAYERRKHRRSSASMKSTAMSRSSSTSSTATYTSDGAYEETKPPPYINLFYNTFDDKPSVPQRRVRFALDEPLSSQPREEERIVSRPITRMRSQSRNGEYAWWAHRQEMDDREYDRIATEKRY